MESVFVDTNIILDWLGKRVPFFEPAKSLFKKCEEGQFNLLISTISVITTEYVLRKELGKEKTRQSLSAVRSLCKVCVSGGREIDLSIASTFRDFEDAFQYYTAINNGAQVFITRNPKDFTESNIPVMSADAFLKSL